MNKKIIILGIIVLLIAVGLSGCVSKEESKFVGTWSCSNAVFVFEDGLLSKNCRWSISTMGNVMTLDYQGTWKVENNRLIIDYNFNWGGDVGTAHYQEIYTYEFSNNNQNLNINGNQMFDYYELTKT